MLTTLIVHTLYVIAAGCFGAFFALLVEGAEARRRELRHRHVVTVLVAQRNARDQVIANLHAELAELKRPRAIEVEDPPFAMAILNTGPENGIRYRARFTPPVPAGTAVEDVSPAQRVGAALLEWLDEQLVLVGATEQEAVRS